jgi:hypothetical protein
MTEIPDETKRRLIKHYLSTPEGRRKIAASMVHPLDARIGYKSLWRKLLEREKTPFCEPFTARSVFSIEDPESIDLLERGYELAGAQIIAQTDDHLIERLGQADRQVVPCSNPAETFPALLEEHREFCKQPGFILLNARDYADIRKFCRDMIDLGVPTLYGVGQPVHHYMSDFEGMCTLCSRIVEPGDIFFVPKGVGRYADTFEVKSVEPEDGATEDEAEEWKPTFRQTMKVCMEIDPEKVKAVRIERA